MSVYLVQGKLGTGKGKYCVDKMRDALREGRRVATNFDLFMENLVGPQRKCAPVRVPDKPTADDLLALGHGSPGDMYNEDNYGLLVLDELGSWLNSRQFQDKGRQALLDYLIHARKHGWHVYLVVQNIDMIDKQVRVGLCEYIVKLIRMDKVRVPVVGKFLGNKLGRLPRFHVANISLADVPGIVVDRDYFRGDDLHGGYDTLQIFREWKRDPGQDGFHAEKFMGSHSMLSAWHLKGRFMAGAQAKSLLQRFFAPRPRDTSHIGPKPVLVARLSKLPRDTAWAYARKLTMQGAL